MRKHDSLNISSASSGNSNSANQSTNMFTEVPCTIPSGAVINSTTGTVVGWPRQPVYKKQAQGHVTSFKSNKLLDRVLSGLNFRQENKTGFKEHPVASSVRSV
jgi:hypothetical protein